MAMAMEVQITSRETIKPSSPTPDRHNLTVLDQFAIDLHVPILLFYSSTPQTTPALLSNHLKKSLQETLTHFYPFAGRAKGSYIDCTQHVGATYIEARVNGNMSEIMAEPEIEKLRKLLPCNPNENLVRFTVPEILLIQVNHFSCGGVAIGVCIRHVIADASTVGTFIRSWGTVARGGAVDGGVVTDCTSIFPPIDLPPGFSSVNDFIDKKSLLEGTVTKRFVFNGSKIAALREKIGEIKIRPCLDLPTRYEAVSALIWGALMSITEEKEEAKEHLAMSAVDLRKRLNPSLPQQCLGNVWQMTTATFRRTGNGGTNDYKELAGRIGESVRKMKDENVRKFHEGDGMLNFVKAAAGEAGKRRTSGGVISFSSWCKFPFYEADFGWGNPVWVATALGHNNVAILLDTRDGEGMEVWLGLGKERMTKFQQNQDILEYASF